MLPSDSLVIDEGNEKIVLNSASQYTALEAFDEVENLLDVAADFSPAIEEEKELLRLMLKELIHFLYATPGQHRLPSEMLYQTVQEELLAMGRVPERVVCND